MRNWEWVKLRITGSVSKEVNVVVQHNVVVDEEEKPTCTEKGRTEGSHCSTCNEVLVEQDVKEKLGHDYEEEWTVDKDATCTEDGSKSHHCSRCGVETDVTEIPKLSDSGHDYEEKWTIDKNATCTEDGSKSHHCSRCSSIIDETVITALGHDGGVATCSEKAICTRCGVGYGELAYNNHVEETELRNQKQPTIVSDGYTGDVCCVGCDAILQAGISVDASGTSVEGNAVDDSYVVQENVTFKDVIFEKDVYIPKGCKLTLEGEAKIIGNVYVFGTLANEATTEIEGTLYCLHYGSSFSAGDYDYGYLENSGKMQIATMIVNDTYLNKDIPELKHVHEWETRYTIDYPATCIESGSKSIHCVGCDVSKEGSSVLIEPIGHVGGEVTCVANAICESCHVEYDKEEEPVHTGGTELCNVVEATAGKDGYSGDEYCKGCGELLKLGSVVKATELEDNTNSSDTESDVKKEKGGQESNIDSIIPKNEVASQGVDINAKQTKKESQKISIAKIKNYKAKKLRKKKVSFNLKAKRTGNGKLTYKVTKYPKKGKKFISVNRFGRVTLKKGAKKGVYKITVTAAETSSYKKAVKVVAIKVK